MCTGFYSICKNYENLVETGQNEFQEIRIVMYYNMNFFFLNGSETVPEVLVESTLSFLIMTAEFVK